MAQCGSRSTLFADAPVVIEGGTSEPDAGASADTALSEAADADAETEAEVPDAPADGRDADRADVAHDDDAHVDAGRDATLPSCALGSVVTDVLGQLAYFSGGTSLLPGQYRLTYVDGCMKYSAAQDWSVNAYGPTGSDGFWVMGGSPPSRIVMPPGTVGFLVGAGGYATFDACVTANLALAPVDFSFSGGPIGIQLTDSPYTDNVVGPNGRNPTWRLSRLTGCSM
jgi:hypothetical protein